MTYTQPLLLVFSLAALIGLAYVGRVRRKAFLVAGILGLVLCADGHPWSGCCRGPWRHAIRFGRFAPHLAFKRLSYSACRGIAAAYLSALTPQADYETLERCAYAAWVYRQIGPMPVLACGGRDSSDSPAVRGRHAGSASTGRCTGEHDLDGARIHIHLRKCEIRREDPAQPPDRPGRPGG